MADIAPALPNEPISEFWQSDSWISIWAGRPVNLPPSGSAAYLVRNALLPGSNVDFPQITEICERVAAEPLEVETAVGQLTAALRDVHAPIRKKLKALTISNEMVYDEACRLTFRCVDGFREALMPLRNARATGLGEAMDETIRMLANELDKNCFSEDGPPPQQGRLRGFGSAITGAARNLGLRSEPTPQQRRSPSPPPSNPVANTFYYDETVKRWRQQGVPDEFDRQPATLAPTPPQPPAVQPSQPLGEATLADRQVAEMAQAPPPATVAPLQAHVPAQVAPPPQAAMTPLSQATAVFPPLAVEAAAAAPCLQTTASQPPCSQPVEAASSLFSSSPAPCVASAPAAVPQLASGGSERLSDALDLSVSPFNSSPAPWGANAPTASPAHAPDGGLAINGAAAWVPSVSPELASSFGLSLGDGPAIPDPPQGFKPAASGGVDSLFS